MKQGLDTEFNPYFRGSYQGSSLETDLLVPFLEFPYLRDTTEHNLNICPSGMFRCPEGRCILSLRVCDYQKDCDKGEDEFQACRDRILGSQVDAASQHSTDLNEGVHTGR
uniref:Uncharacterized protein n=1 Tax=Timema genevievae TaxID=629358 RepID=A0A7R9PN54_TIMGE|nr:unnamed protein product [Timema genevievae]